MALVKVKFSYRNRATKSVITGARNFRAPTGGNFHSIVDTLARKLKRMKPALLKKLAPGECPDEWEVLGFQDWHDWDRRRQRAISDTAPQQ